MIASTLSIEMGEISPHKMKSSSEYMESQSNAISEGFRIIAALNNAEISNNQFIREFHRWFFDCWSCKTRKKTMSNFTKRKNIQERRKLFALLLISLLYQIYALTMRNKSVWKESIATSNVTSLKKKPYVFWVGRCSGSSCTRLKDMKNLMRVRNRRKCRFQSWWRYFVKLIVLSTTTKTLPRLFEFHHSMNSLIHGHACDAGEQCSAFSHDDKIWNHTCRVHPRSAH